MNDQTELSPTEQVTCPNCEGSRESPDADGWGYPLPCHWCNGTGKFPPVVMGVSCSTSALNTPEKP